MPVGRHNRCGKGFVLQVSQPFNQIDWGSRKVILFPALIVTLICFGLLPVVVGTPIWVLMILSGVFADGFMAVSVTMLLETDGVGRRDFGTAMGIIMTIAQVGTVLSPPLGNSFAGLNPGLPFTFWAARAAAALFTLAPIKEATYSQRNIAKT